MNKLLVNPKFKGTTKILINGATPANGSILYVANGVICVVNPPADGTNKALCITNNLPSWETITAGTGGGIWETTYPKVQAKMLSGAWQQNDMQEGGGVADGLTISMVENYPVLSSLLTIENTFVDDFRTHVKYNW